MAFLVQFIRYRSSRQEVFCKTGVIRNFAKFTGRHMFQDLFFNKVVLTPFLGFFELLFLLITFFINFCLTACLNTLLNFSRSTLLYNRIYCIKHVFDMSRTKRLQYFKRALVSWNGKRFHQTLKGVSFNYFKAVTKYINSAPLMFS